MVALRTSNRESLLLAASEWLAESFFINGSIASAIAVQTTPATPSWLNSLV